MGNRPPEVASASKNWPHGRLVIGAIVLSVAAGGCGLDDGTLLPALPVPTSDAMAPVTGTPSGVISLRPASPVSVVNCYPFGATLGDFAGFIYRNVPPFELRRGDLIEFDLGAPNDMVIRRNVFFAAANINPEPAIVSGDSVVSQGVLASGPWIRVASDSQVPANPRGNGIIGDYELRWTAETSFSFAGGGLLVGFNATDPSAADGTCTQVLSSTRWDDASGNFYSRFYHELATPTTVLDDAVGSTALYVGGMVIERNPLNPSDGIFDWPLGACASQDDTPGHNVEVMQNYRNLRTVNGTLQRHTGVDLYSEESIAATEGAPVLAAADGYVACNSKGAFDARPYWEGPGRIVVIAHDLPDGSHLYSVYGHLQEDIPEQGTQVRRGDVIGRVQSQFLNGENNTHLHFEIRSFPYWNESTGAGTTEPPAENKSISCAGPGYISPNAQPETFGWKDPVEFHFDHRPGMPVLGWLSEAIPLRTSPFETDNIDKQLVPGPIVITGISKQELTGGGQNFWYHTKAGNKTRYLLAYDHDQSEDGSPHDTGSYDGDIYVGEAFNIGPMWTPPAGRPIISYRFDSRSSYARGRVPNGAAGSGYEGVISGPTSLVTLTADRNDHQLRFDGLGSYVEASGSASLPLVGGFALEAILWPRAAIDEDETIAGQYGSWWLGLRQDVGDPTRKRLTLRLILQNGSTKLYSYPLPACFTPGSPQRVSLWYRPGGQGLALFWNDRRVSAVEYPGPGTLAPPTGPIHIGAMVPTFGGLEGAIDQFNLWTQ